MARPKKHPSEMRDQRFNLRFTEAELAHVETQAAIAGLEPHDYLRRRALGYEVPSSATRRTDPELIKKLNDLGLQLSAIGNNANQLALAAHTDRRAQCSWEDTVALIAELRGQVTGTLEKVVLRDP